MLLKFADLVEDSSQELAEIECENTGKPLGLMYSLEDHTRVKHVMQHHGFEG